MESWKWFRRYFFVKRKAWSMNFLAVDSFTIRKILTFAKQKSTGGTLLIMWFFTLEKSFCSTNYQKFSKLLPELLSSYYHSIELIFDWRILKMEVKKKPPLAQSRETNAEVNLFYFCLCIFYYRPRTVPELWKIIPLTTFD